MPTPPSKTVFVIANRGRFLAGCRHPACPAWVSLKSGCVRLWMSRELAQKHIERTQGMPMPGRPVMPDTAVVREVQYSQVCLPPSGDV